MLASLGVRVAVSYDFEFYSAPCFLLLDSNVKRCAKISLVTSKEHKFTQVLEQEIHFLITFFAHIEWSKIIVERITLS